MALRRIPCKDLLSVTVRQPISDQIPPSGHCYISFKAGIMSKVEGKMKADKRKGQVAVVRNNDGLVVLQWYERIAGEGGNFTLAEEPEVDQIIFEWEGRMEWLNKDKRAITMKFKEDADRALYFWLQEPETKWDEELILRANKAINGHSWVPSTAAGTGAATATTSASPTPATSQPAAQSSSGLPLTPDGQLFNFNELVAGMQARLQQQHAAAGPALADILTPDAVSDFMKLPGMLEALQEHLPKEHRTQEELEALPRTAQFVQQLQGFSSALRTNHVDLSQFGLQPKGLTVVDFLEAIKALAASEVQEKDDGPAPMES